MTKTTTCSKCGKEGSGREREGEGKREREMRRVCFRMLYLFYIQVELDPAQTELRERSSMYVRGSKIPVH